MVKINPVKAICTKFQPDCDIVEANDACYEICAAFSGTTDPYNMNPECTKMCDNYIEELRIMNFGVGRCDHQTPHKPVIWNQVPNYVPQLIRDGRSPQDALQQGLKMCAQHVPTLVNQCQDKCRLHYAAIEQYKPVGPKFTAKPPKHDKKKALSVVWLVVVVLLAIMISIGIYFRK